MPSIITVARLAGGPPPRRATFYSGFVQPIEIVYTALLVLVALLITWFALYVVYRLMHEEK